MTWIMLLMGKMATWALPRVTGKIVNGFRKSLGFVEAAEGLAGETADKRDYVLTKLKAEFSGLYAPETVLRFLVEFSVLLHGVGVTSEQMAAAEVVVNDCDGIAFADADKRASALKRLNDLFPVLPERIARLLIELAVARLRYGTQEK
jgi:hypothetical protein